MGFQQQKYEGKILSDIVKLRKMVGGLQARKVNGVPYAVKSARELDVKLREAADKLDMVMAGSVVYSSINPEPSDKGTKVHVTVTVRFMSDDGSYLDFMGVGSGQATDDKAGGKAFTYAHKVAVCKGCMLPDAEMVDTDDESIPAEAYDWIEKIEAVESKGALEDLKIQLGKLSANVKQHTVDAFRKKQVELG